LLCLSLAAISDYFDGYLARRLKQETRLGLILDPLSDKILAAVLVVLLIRYRAFPLWLAGIIVGRDLMILAGGMKIRSRLKVIPSSDLTGKYCFAAIAVLLVSHIIEFSFGVTIMTVTALVLVAASLASYGVTLAAAMNGRATPKIADRPAYRYARVVVTWSISLVYLFKLGQMIGWW
jgi:CDP-diacylglycerol--glycerol-3-phosphate 3-phosphatidyltransferase